MSVAAEDTVAAAPKSGGLERGIDWTGAFWVASGVPPLVLFSIGAVAATVGKLSWVIWMLSIAMGFIQSFTYAEIAGLFPDKAGGTSIYGAIGWVRYGKLIAPVSVWCNWFAWSPVQATGSALAAGYILNGIFAPDSAVNSWQVPLLDLGSIKTGLSLRINSTFLLGAAILLAVKAIQDGGILRSANTTKILGISAMIPLILIGVVPLLTGDIVKANFFPLVPLAHDAAGRVADGSWNMAGITVFAAGMFLAAWSTYGFETAVCYTGEFKNPKTDTFKAIFYSGLLCVVVYTLVPFAFQGFLGLGTMIQPAVTDAAGNITAPAVYGGMLAPDIYSGMGVSTVMARMVHAGQIGGVVVVVMLILALVLSLMTSMAGSSRTLYQASVDGWLPKYLAKVNSHGAPTNAMMTNLVFNLVLLLLSDSVFVIGAANIGYLIFNFLNLNAGWIHRCDRPRQERPWRAPTWILGAGAVLSFVNLAFMGFGADVYGAGTLTTGLVFAALIVPVFIYRHYVQDKGSFPREMAEDLEMVDGERIVKRAGIWPYVVLALGVAVVAVTHELAVY
ncbi:MAG: amino acid permease-associated region [Gammaproteobacteria bacterium]|nr:amino acid permease-associated region [Gammaproteobacteria bacterium]